MPRGWQRQCLCLRGLRDSCLFNGCASPRLTPLAFAFSPSICDHRVAHLHVPHAWQTEIRWQWLWKGSRALFGRSSSDLSAGSLCVCHGWADIAVHPVYTAAQTVGDVFLNKKQLQWPCVKETNISDTGQTQTFAQDSGFLSLKPSAKQTLTFPLLFHWFPHHDAVMHLMEKCLLWVTASHLCILYHVRNGIAEHFGVWNVRRVCPNRLTAARTVSSACVPTSLHWTRGKKHTAKNDSSC